MLFSLNVAHLVICRDGKEGDDVSLLNFGERAHRTAHHVCTSVCELCVCQ